MPYVKIGGFGQRIFPKNLENYSSGDHFLGFWLKISLKGAKICILRVFPIFLSWNVYTYANSQKHWPKTSFLLTFWVKTNIFTVTSGLTWMGPSSISEILKILLYVHCFPKNVNFEVIYSLLDFAYIVKIRSSRHRDFLFRYHPPKISINIFP